MITLTTKDADWVANIAREEINDLKEFYQFKYKEMDSIIDNARKLCASLPSEENLKGFSEVEEKYIEAKQVIINEEIKDINKWTKVIELMVGGSDE